jgi:hypothetical protein
MATNPQFASVANIQGGKLTTANPNLDGTGAVVTVFTASANGSRVHRITVKATQSVVAGLVRIFLHNGSNYFLFREVIISLTTISATVQSAEEVLELFGEEAILLPNSNWSIRASTTISQNFDVIVEGANY